MCAPHVMAMVQETVSRRRLLGTLGASAAALTAMGVAGSRIATAQEATPVAATPPASGAVTMGNFTNVQDLSHVFGPEFPLFPGTHPMSMWVANAYDTDGYFSNVLELNEHTATHMDAPAHFFEGGLTAELVAIENLVVPMAVIDISARAATDDDAQLTPDDIAAWEAANGPLPERALVAMHSGWEARLVDPASYINLDADGVQHYPGFHPEAAALLVEERAISGIAVDTLSQDYGASQDFGTHVAILGAGKYGIENMAGLANVPPAGAMAVIGVSKYINASGGPVRAFAFFS